MAWNEAEVAFRFQRSIQRSSANVRARRSWLANGYSSAGLESVLESTDVIVAAGGDGTVSTAARAVAGRDIPVAILPLGTANNIARSLGIEGSIPHPRARLARAARKYRDALPGLRAYRWTLTLDGTRQDGDLLVLEVLNFRSGGPNLVLFSGWAAGQHGLRKYRVRTLT